MTDVTKLKLGMALIGVAIFGAGINLENGRVRAIGIAFVAVAWLLRFVRQSRDEPEDATGSPTSDAMGSDSIDPK